MKTELVSSFLFLVRLGIGHPGEKPVSIKDWQSIRCLAKTQGLYAVALDGIEMLPESSRPSQRLLLEWIGEVLQSYEHRYEEYKRAIFEMARFYNSHGYKMMVLKGYACSLDWPKPEHRPCGDIDIWQFGKQKEADRELFTWFKDHGSRFEIDNSHHHHTVFNWGNFSVENHYDFINIHRHYSHRGLEKIFKELGQDDSYFVELKVASTDSVTKVYLPSPNLHALFLIRHALNHFASVGINLRQVLDWAFFAEKHTNDIDWHWLRNVLEKYHMMDFFKCLNAICVEDLGFEARIFKEVQFNSELKNKVLCDILSPEYEVKARLTNMLKRWQGNRWKHKLCYKESMWCTLWSGVRSHLQNPKSF